MLKRTFLSLYISKYSGGACLHTPLATRAFGARNLPRLVLKSGYGPEMIKLFFRNEVELNKETKKNTEEFSKRQQFIKSMWVNCMKFSPYLKPEEFATARKRKLVGNTDASQPRLVWGKRMPSFREMQLANWVHFSRFFYDSTAPGGSMSGNLFPTPSRRCENQIDSY